MALALYNTYSKKEEPFEPREPGRVSMYTCGPTVYGRPHVGNYSSFLMADLLRRWMEAGHGYVVTHVKNITDVGHLVADADTGEDKIEKQARAEHGSVTHESVIAIARKYEEQYLEDEKLLNMLEPAKRPRASETIPEMIAIIETLVKNGNAYETSDGVYFDVVSFPRYGRLSGNALENLDAGSRVAVDEEKRHPADFALWKKTVGANAKHVLRWPSPWGDGFPGWHIECSAMARKELGDTLDVHTGGEDNIFPHHECEIAQSECSGPQPFSRFWLHKRRIDLAGGKMSKSIGNVIVLPDIITQEYSPLDLRYYLLSVHYRTNLKFAWKGMEDARKARRKIVEWMERMKTAHADGAATATVEQVAEWEARFRSAMDADLNTSGALAALFEMMAWSRGCAWPTEARLRLLAFLQMARHTFGCFEPESHVIASEIRQLLDERAAARAKKDFAGADRIRDLLMEKGYEVKDTAGGQEIRRF